VIAQKKSEISIFTRPDLRLFLLLTKNICDCTEKVGDLNLCISISAFIDLLR
jgi:hypothetical protein